MVISVVWTLVVVTVVMPALRNGASLETDWYYGWIIEGEGALAHLGRMGEQLTNGRGWLGAMGLLVSTVGLGLFRPAWLLFVLPPVVANLMSANLAQADFKLHYTLLSIVPVLVATALGGRRLLAWLGRRRRRRTQRGADGTVRRRTRGAALLALAIPALLVAWIGGGLPPTMRTARGQWDRPPARDDLLRIATHVPDDAILAVDDGLAPSLASRVELRLIPHATAEAWVLVDRQARDPGYFSWDRREVFVEELPQSGRPLLSDAGRFQLWGPVDD